MIPEPMNMNSKVALVVGAEASMGRAVAVLLSQLGARVIVAANDEAGLVETMDLLEGEGHQLATFPPGSVDAFPGWMQTIVKTTGLLDAVCFAESFGETEQLQTARLLRTFGLVKGLRHKKVRSSSSSFVVVFSLEGWRGSSVLASVGAGEGALPAMVKSLAMEVAREHIRVNGLAVGPMNSEQSLLGEGTPQDVANAAAFLLSDTGLWITGTTMVVDGGFSLASQGKIR